MWEIWANYLLPKALKSCQKSNKSPNLVTLVAYLVQRSTDDGLAVEVQGNVKLLLRVRLVASIAEDFAGEENY